MAIFVVLWSYLLTTKLSCLQKNNFGHTKEPTILINILCSLANILTPFTAGTVWQRYHNGLQVVTDDFEFANALELHGFACQIFLRCDCVGENVQKEGATTRGVYPKRYDITNHGLEKINCQNTVCQY